MSSERVSDFPRVTKLKVPAQVCPTCESLLFYFMQPIEVSFGGLLLGSPKLSMFIFSGQFFFQPTPVLCSGPPSHLSWFCSSSLTSLSCPMELGHPLSYCGWWWPCSSPQFIFSFVLGGSRLLLVALICLIQCSKQSLRSRQRVRNCNLLSFSSPSLPSTSFILSRPKTFSPTTPKRGCCPQMLGIGDTFHCDSVSKYDSKLACCSYPFLVPAV